MLASMRIAGVLRRATGLLLLLGLCACRPGRAASTGSSESESSSSESGDPITTGSNDESDEAETDDPSGPNIIPYPDAFCSAAGGFYCTPSCDPLAQDCPEGEKCTPFASTGGTWDDYKCVPVLGELGPGESCTYDDPVLATDDCGSTSMCYDGVCRSFCKPPYDTPACPVGYGCADVGMTEGPVVCLPSCDPLAQDCEIGSCYGHENREFLCEPTGTLGVGEACGFVNDCVAGSVCVDAGLIPNCQAEACCSPLCSLGQADCASLPGTECTAWFEPGQAPVGLESLGVCSIP